MENGNAFIFRLNFTTEKVHVKQTNILSVNRHQENKITYRRDHACIFFARFQSRVTDFNLQNLTF